MVKSTPKEIFYYGEARPLPKQVFLKAGPLNMVYENGAIRYIRYGETEVLRMVYAAVRNHNWDTIEPIIRKETIQEEGNSFTIDVEIEYRQDELHFIAHYTFTGSETGVVRFEMKGKCLSSFQKNRIGFCILHPIHECAGNDCTVTKADGRVIGASFPNAISPHQPFMNIKALQWKLPKGCSATLRFEGDVFETEDQRNWTDASFKTYSTPLDLPFPVQMHAGEEVNQVVELSLPDVQEAVTRSSQNQKQLNFTISNSAADLPKIGVGSSTEVEHLSARAVELLRRIGFHHYRYDVKFHKPDWKKLLAKACRDAEALGLPLELALHLSEKQYAEEAEAFCRHLLGSKADIYAILLFQDNKKTTPTGLIHALVPQLRRCFPAAKIGGGTNAYFTELNRQTPPSEDLDFLTYSINPQVHAFDNLSLIETLEIQGHTVTSAKNLARGKEVHVSPVTFKPRFNPNATATNAGEDPELQIDARQRSLFGASWTLGSIKYMAEAGAKSLTYYETAGRKGLLMPQGKAAGDLFPAEGGDVFPIYAVLQYILEDPQAKVLYSKSSDPLVFDGLVLKKHKGQRIILSNFTIDQQEVKIPIAQGKFQVYQLDEHMLMNPDWAELLSSKPSRVETENRHCSVALPPFGLLIIDVD
ncbi:hypothetical protein D770_14540 [Flammeovirgaceae bacterium 311]|nr:hypothetical protein D770_14540 [Flammeovirgaceae bacterium 311]